MSKNEAWEESESAFRMIHQDRCIVFDCGCNDFIEKIKEALCV